MEAEVETERELQKLAPTGLEYIAGNIGASGNILGQGQNGVKIKRETEKRETLIQNNTERES